MKKLVLSLLLAASTLAHAEFNPQGKVVKVVVPYPITGNPGILFRVMQSYAAQQNIVMVPEYKPGASGLIGLQYAAGESTTGHTLTLSIISDLAANNLQDKFDHVSALTTTSIVMASSKSSKLQTLDDVVRTESSIPGKLNWGIANNALSRMTMNLASLTKLDKEKIIQVPYTGAAKVVQGIVSGDIDVALLPASIAYPAADSNLMNIVEVSDSVYLKLKIKTDGYALHAPKNTNPEATKYWSNFIEKFQADKEVQSQLKSTYMTPLPGGQQQLAAYVSAWVK
jgi:tripartite-type tricarboxylate transporter receptor subunit TctC